MRVKDIGEFGLIDRLMTGQALSPGVVVPAGDDAAVVEITPGCRVLYTCDCMVESVHFLPTAKGRDVGYKLMASNISDIAAMGGIPRYAVVNLVTPAETEVAWLEAVYEGMRECSQQYSVAIVGGDTSRGPAVTISVSLIGEVEPNRELLRSGAQVGDLVCVTGALGGSAAGLQVVLGRVSSKHPAADFVLSKHYRPQPRVREGLALAALNCRCANDISDGLASEAREIATSSGVGVELIAEDIPIREEVRAIAAECGIDPLEWALCGGEDYELVFTVPPESIVAVQEALPCVKVVGAVTQGCGVHLRRGELLQPVARAYTHFG